MYIRKIYLKDYKPLITISNIHEITLILDERSINCVLGDNGSGKTSILKELTPFPPVSTSFLNTGKKELEIVHDEIDYVIKTDFNNKEHTHSFMRGAEELNISGKSNVQLDLCLKHFGYSTFIDKLFSNNFKISELRKHERKELFFKIYPSDITFISDTYKKVISKIKEIKSNIKMLEDRKSDLKTRMISKVEYRSMLNEKENLEAINNNIDQLIFILNYYNDDKGKQITNSPTLNELQKSSNLIYRRITDLKKQTTINLTNNPEKRLAILESKKVFQNKKFKDLLNDLDKEKEALNKLEELDSIDLVVLIKELEDNIDSNTTFQNDLNIDKTISVIVEDRLSDFASRVFVISNRLRDISEDNLTFLDPKEASDLNNEAYSISKELEFFISNRNQLETQLDKKLSDQNRRTRFSYPKECELKCGLRTHFSKIKKEIQSEIDVFCEKKIKISKTILDLETRQNEVKTLLQYVYITEPIYAEISSILSSYTCKNYVLEDHLLNIALSRSPLKIAFKLKKIIENSKNIVLFEKKKNQISKDCYKLDILKKTKLPVQELLNSTILEKRAIMAEKEIEYLTIQKEIFIDEKHTNLLKQFTSNKKEFENLKKAFEETSICEILKKEILFNKKKIEELSFYKKKTNASLKVLDDEVLDQKKIRIKLNEEILPSLKKCYTELNDVENLEKGLSPSRGIPQIYISRLLNSIIEIANEFIKDICTYPMEISTLDENQLLDFNFAVLFDTHPVSEIKLCSTAQKRIIDISFTIALCVFTNMSEHFGLRIDEMDSFLNNAHTVRLAAFLTKTVKKYNMTQLFMVAQRTILLNSFKKDNIFCLTDGMCIDQSMNPKMIKK